MSLALAPLVLAYVPAAHAGSITAEGNCVALTDYSQMSVLTGQATFDEGPTSGDVPLDQYASYGMTFQAGPLSAILPGVTTPGEADAPRYREAEDWFPAPIGGSGIQTGNMSYGGGVGLFDVVVTKFGLTAGKNGNQYITAWGEGGYMLGQVTWDPFLDSSFVGIDCGQAAIKMIAVGNDDLYSGETMEIGGSSTHTDHWVWSGDTTCGNGTLDAGEECDDANNDFSDDCTLGCNSAECGDRFVWEGVEACDDGNADNTDSCVEGCVAASCGDGFLWTGVEACDDGNTDNADDCVDTCEEAFCGDGHVWAGVEACDDGNTDDQDACLSTCVSATCGDGFVQTDVEECDDGNDIATDGCTDACKLPFCGDGIVRDTLEECDDANEDVADACPNCMNAFCGDGYVYEGVEECDDGNDDDSDGCLADCTVNDGGSDTDEGTTSDASDTGTTTTDTTTDSDSTPGPDHDQPEDGLGLDDAGTGCGCTSSGKGGIAFLLLFGLGTVRRRATGRP